MSNSADQDNRSVISTYSSGIAAASSGAVVGGFAGTVIAGPVGGIIGSGVAAVGAALGLVLWTTSHPIQNTSTKSNSNSSDR